MTKSLDPEKLRKLYLEELLNPYQIAEQLGCNHKTVRSYLKKYRIPLRTASEYNYLPRKTHICPSEEELSHSKSIAAHIAYLCEGWHTSKTNMINFVNQDTQLIDLFVGLLKNTYQVKSVRLEVAAPNKESASLLLDIYPTAKFRQDTSRKKAIVKVLSGGKSLARDLIQNAYKILNSLSS